MYAFTVDYTLDDLGAPIRPRRDWINHGFFVHGTPRLILWCRLFGHRPVVDGTDSPVQANGYRGPSNRWVVCDRCGVRGAPQGELDPGLHAIGDRYLGPWGPKMTAREVKLRVVGDGQVFMTPGPIEARPRGQVGGQLVIGDRSALGGLGFEVKVGHPGSDHTLSAAIHLAWLGSLYLHTQWHGTWLQRRLNPTGYESRVIGVRIDQGLFIWRCWSRRDACPSQEPWWQHTEVSLRVLDKLLGRKLYERADVPGGQTSRYVKMPEGEYLVRLTLKRIVAGRKRWRKQRYWTVDWSVVEGDGIPTEGPTAVRGRISSASAAVSDQSVAAGTWPAEAAVAIAANMTARRTVHGWEPIGLVPIRAGT